MEASVQHRGIGYQSTLQQFNQDAANWPPLASLMTFGPESALREIPISGGILMVSGSSVFHRTVRKFSNVTGASGRQLGFIFKHWYYRGSSHWYAYLYLSHVDSADRQVVFR